MNLDLSTIRVRRAASAEDLEKAMRVRWAGYKKYFSDFAEISDKFDSQENCVLLLATDARTDEPLGTMRLLKSDAGRTEIEDFLPVREMLAAPYQNFIEATRLSVPHHELSREIKFALKKTYYHCCLANGFNTMLLWVRHPAVREYRAWHFFDINGGSGVFSHPALGNNEHRTMICDIAKAVDSWRNENNPYLPLLISESYKNLRFD